MTREADMTIKPRERPHRKRRYKQQLTTCHYTTCPWCGSKKAIGSKFGIACDTCGWGILKEE